MRVKCSKVGNHILAAWETFFLYIVKVVTVHRKTVPSGFGHNTFSSSMACKAV